MSENDEYKRVIIPAGAERYDRQLHRLNIISRKLVEFVNYKDIQYGSSWRKRGGAGAFFTIIRKFDRFETSCSNENFDVFKCFATDNRKESILDDCLDITGYMLLLIEHMVEVGHVTTILGSTFCKSDHSEELTKKPEKKPEINTPREGVEQPHPFDYDEAEDDV